MDQLIQRLNMLYEQCPACQKLIQDLNQLLASDCIPKDQDDRSVMIEGKIAASGAYLDLCCMALDMISKETTARFGNCHSDQVYQFMQELCQKVGVKIEGFTTFSFSACEIALYTCVKNFYRFLEQLRS